MRKTGMKLLAAALAVVLLSRLTINAIDGSIIDRGLGY